MQGGFKGTLSEGARVGLIWIFSGTLKEAVKLLKREVEHWRILVQNIGGLFRAWSLSWSMQLEMAPKSARNVADKTESVRQARMVKEGSDGHFAGKRALGGLTKAGCKINAGAVRDCKDQLRGAQPDNKPRDKLQSKTQPSITDFLTYEDPGAILKDPAIPTEVSGGASSGELGLCMDAKLGENSLGSKNPQDYGEGLMSEVKRPEKKIRLSDHLIAHNNIQEQERAKETQSLIEGCPESCVKKRTAQERTGPAAGEDVDKNWSSEIEKVEYDGRNGDWLKDGGDKFYSLMEESEAASSGYDLNEEGSSSSSESGSLAESLSPVAGPTLRPQHRHHKHIKSRTGSVGITDSPAAMLKWDYSGIRLSQSERALQVLSDMALTLNLTASENCPDEQANNMASSDTKMLQLIYGTVRELQTETQTEN
ncbi:hypothetical protein NDU88_004612 [Pleurodeles waltl]|uniref:Uncharacterized protein n=1 Tax=Pleurodeles waltl TaxID=8319 RepID=A0AAV7TUP1_PLEWA|nr:hypothetical protein NDU88_004612 [Pleurodeles waltl]